jgi:HAD superfamily hydrolase (TIGR01509 family)
MKISAFDAIIFDHDGTLVDTESCDFQACKMLCAELGAPLSLASWAEKIVGRVNGYDELFDDILQTHPNGYTKADMWRRLRELWPITLENVTIMPGVSRLLPGLQAAGYVLGVATASDRAWANRWLARFDLLSYFQVIATRDDVIHNKPAPDVYLFAASQLGTPPARCLVFEDSVAGIQAAKAAGMTVVAVPNHVTSVLNFSQADEVITSLEQVTEVWLAGLQKRLAFNKDVPDRDSYPEG